MSIALLQPNLHDSYYCYYQYVTHMTAMVEKHSIYSAYNTIVEVIATHSSMLTHAHILSMSQ